MLPIPILPLIGLAVQYAPSIIGLLAGDSVGKATDKVIGAVKEVLGTSDPVEARAKLEANPSLGEELTARLNAEVETLRIQAEDTANARAMGVNLVQAGHWTANMPAVIVILVFVMQFAITSAIFFIPGEIPDRMFQLLTAAFGTSSTAFGIAMQYYLGSNRASAQKDTTIAAQAQAAALKR